MSASGTSDSLAPARTILRERFSHEGFLPGQEAAVRSVLAGRDLLVVMPTGSGKSLLYQLPALLDARLTLVVSPLIALMKDQVDELTRRGIPATFVNSSLSLDEQHRRLDRCMAGEVRLLYVAPERFRSAAFCDMVRRVEVGRMAVDEAHCISEWGHDFRPDYRRLKQFREQMGSPRVTALTATATPRVQQDIVESLGLAQDEVDVHVHGFDRPNLVLSVIQAHDEAMKDEFVLDFLKQEPGSGIVYVGTRRTADELALTLREVEPTAAAYHAGLDPADRSRAQEAFLSGRARVVVATIAFGMGIDKADVRFVLHYHFPASVEGYYQEIGRAGRDGLDSQCTMLYSPGDRRLREFFIDLAYPPPEMVEDVYETLWGIHDNPIRMTYKEIAELCSYDLKDGQVGSAIRLLDAAGVTRALSGDATAAVKILRPGAEVLRELRGRVQRGVFEALSVAADLERPGWYRVGLGQIGSASGLSAEQVRRGLAALDKDGHIEYEPPFRGRGVQKLADPPPPFGELPIDWKRQRMLRRLEEEKLDTMEEYIRTRQCRRAFIVQYFGEEADLVCGTCDCCQGAKHKKPREGGVLAQSPQTTAAVLECLAHLRFPLGAQRVAQVVTGSRAQSLLEWGLDRNPAYGRVTATQDDARRVIDRMLDEGYLERRGEVGRPVLGLTPLGEEIAEEVAVDEIGTVGPGPPETPAASVPQSRGDADEDIRFAALTCVVDLDTPLGANKVAGIITGSQAEWAERLGAADVAAYDSVAATQQHARDVIRAMMAEGLFRLGPNAAYPVLELTDAGERELLKLQTAYASAAQAQRPSPEPEPPAWMTDGPPPPPEPPLPGAAEVLDGLVHRILTCDREAARSVVDDLRLFHPREIAPRLADRYDGPGDARARSRAVWAAGELCGPHAVAFLCRCSHCEEADIRRLAAAALGKAAAAGGPTDPSGPLAEAREALTRLSNDPAADVRRQAGQALGRLAGGQRHSDRPAERA